MKKLILLIAIVASSAFADEKVLREEVELVNQNAFECIDQGITLKGLWGDLFGSWNYQGQGFFKRKEMKGLHCASMLEYLWREGKPEALKFLLQVKSFQRPDMWASLLGLETKLNDKDRETARAYLSNYGVPVDTPTSKLGQLLVSVTVGEKKDKQFYEKFSALTTGENETQINLLARILPNKYIIEVLLDLERDGYKLSADIDRLLTQYLRGYSKSAFETATGKVQVNTQLLLSNRGKFAGSLDNFYYDHVEENILASFATKDQEYAAYYFKNLLSRFQRATLRELGDRPTFNGHFCHLLVGNIDPFNQEFGKQALEMYRITGCETTVGIYILETEVTPNGIKIKTTNGSDLLDDPKKTGLVEKLLATRQGASLELKRKIDAAIDSENCALFKHLRPLYKHAAEYSADLIAHAAEKKCGDIVKDLATIMTSNQAVNFFEDRVKDKKIDKKYIADIVRILNSNGRYTPDYLNKTIEQRYGREVFRMANIARRVSDPQAQEKLAEAEDKDSDEIVQLKWKDVVIELQRSKMTDIQQLLVDRIRLAKNKEDIAMAFREAMIEWQLKIKYVRTAADALRESIALFKPAADQLASLDQAKIVLDQTMTKGGRPAIYNERFTSVLDPIISGRAQCNGGTDFMLLHSGKSGLEDSNEWQVVVFQPKHILPGVIRKSLTSKVETVESTVNKEGRGTIEASHGQWPLDRKVILADDYLVAKLLGSAMKDRAKNAAEFSARAEKVLGVKQGDISPSKPKEEGKSSGYSDELNVSSFGFGDAEIPSGDIVRQDMNVVPQNLSGVEATRLAVPREEIGSRLSRFAPTKPQQGFGTFRMQVPEYARVVIPKPQEDPLGHISASIERELRYGKIYHPILDGDASVLRYRVDNLLRKLTGEQLNILADVVMRSNGAIVDVVINKQSNLKSQIESPAQKQITDSRDLVDMYVATLAYIDALVGKNKGYGYGYGYGGSYSYGSPSIESVFYPRCSIESREVTQMRSRDPKSCDFSDDYSMIDANKRVFQQNRKTKLHSTLIKFTVLLQDTGSDTPFILDLIMDAEDDGDFTVYFQPFGTRGDWRNLIRKQKREGQSPAPADTLAPTQNGTGKTAPSEKEGPFL